MFTIKGSVRVFGKIKEYFIKNTKYGNMRYLNYLYKYDMSNFFEYSCMNEKNHENIATQIRLISHSIEKGMSLPNCKIDFGKTKILKLIELIEKYQENSNIKDPQALEIANSTIMAYIEFQKQRGITIDFLPESYQVKNCEIKCGIQEYKRKEKTNFSEIANNRHSCRYYQDKEIDNSIIEKIIEIAKTAPSACNRQPIRIFACKDNNKKIEIMNMHGGMKGFGMPAAIFAITGDLNLYNSEFERNTVYIDGGIFIMNLLYAIDSLGLVSCPIIWGQEPDMDKKLAKILDIPPSYKIISLITVGYYPDETYKSAVSSKRKTSEILRIV